MNDITLNDLITKLEEYNKEEVEIVPEEEITEPVLQEMEEVIEPVKEKEVVEVNTIDDFFDEDISSIVEEISTEVKQELNIKEEKEEIELLEPVE